MQALSLYELNSLVRDVIELNLNLSFWVEAEVSDLNESRGHCYMDLIQKEEGANTPIARASAKCWRSTWAVLKPYFIKNSGQVPHAGMKMLLQVHADFHENYGFSWIITDIDPTYSLGDMIQKRRRIIEQLKKEGVLTLNKELPLPLFAQRIAVISSDSAAGYGDFQNQLLCNERHLAFTTTLFPAIMQGERVSESVIAALNSIMLREDEFDCVVIIRGGGATSDLSGFDTLELAENVANFPLPIITGIGHERDESVIDMISHTRVKTPTAAAAFLTDHLSEVAERIDNAARTLTHIVTQQMKNEHHRIDMASQRLNGIVRQTMKEQQHRIARLQEHIPAACMLIIARQRSRLDMLQMRIPTTLSQRIQKEHHRLLLTETQLKTLDPELPLKRGYSITLHRGKPVKDIDMLQPGEQIETRIATGTITSIVTETQTGHTK
ncbi:MAG: exodeoxyribonuclease VII large subunit [Prevotella sp.]